MRERLNYCVCHLLSSPHQRELVDERPRLRSTTNPKRLSAEPSYDPTFEKDINEKTI